MNRNQTPPSRRALSRRSSLSLYSLVLLVLGLLAPAAFSQGTTSVLGGKVFDPGGSSIQGATVIVTSNETGVEWTAQTNSTGNWQVNALVSGNYRFVVTAQGFERLEHSAVELQIADEKLVDVTLAIGKASDTITVNTETPLIDTSASISGTTLSSADFDELPSESGSPMDFVTLAPGVFISPPTGGAALLWSNNSLSSIVSNGAGSGNNAMNYMIDGATNTIASSGQEALIPPSDAVGQMRVLTNAYDASIERTAAGTVNMTIKNGGKQFHGALFERDMNTAFNANRYENNANHIPTPAVHLNEWGGSVGGPVWIPKIWDGRKKGTFFFFNYDGIKNVSPGATGYLSVPTQAERNGDFSQSVATNTLSGVTTDYNLVIYDPATATPTGDRTPFQNAIIDPSRISPIAKAILALVPLPNRAPDIANTDTNNYTINQPKIDKFDNYISRVDQAWNNNHHTYFEYRYNHLNELAADPFGPTNILAGAYLFRTNYGGTINHSWVISSRLVATLIGNITNFRTSQYAPGNAPGVKSTSFGFSTQFAAEQLTSGLPAITGLFNTLGNTGGPSYENDYNYEGRASIEHIVRNHSFHYGIGYLVQQEATGSTSGGAGSYNFSNIWTTANPNTTAGTGVGSSLASFLLGLPNSGSINRAANAYYSQPYIGPYFQDEWRINPRLNVSAGIRWDYQFGLTERHDQYYSRFDPNYDLTSITNYAQPNYSAAIAASSTNIGTQLLQQQRGNAAGFVARGAILYAGQNGTSRSVADTQGGYFQPRFGVAYTLRPNLVLRAGLGRFAEANFVSGHANQTGYSSTTTFTATTDNYITPSSSLDDPYSGGLVANTGNKLGVYTNPGAISSFYSPDTKRQYTDDYSVRFQYQLHDFLFEVGSVYEHTNGLVVGYHINNPTLTQWQAAYDPQFDATGRPLDTLSGDTQVANPFKGAPYITNSLATSSTVSAFSLLRPNPLVGDLVENFYNGTSDHYALQSKVQRRLRNGFGTTVSFSWGKQMDATGFVTNSQVAQKILRQLSNSDRRFQLTAAPVYTLPFGRGKLVGSNSNGFVNSVIGGWELSAKYTFYSGTPIGLPTDSGFFEGGDPAISNKNSKKWFDTSKFVAFPSINTKAADIHNTSIYPEWTGVTSLPGANWTPVSSKDKALNGVYNDFRTYSANNPTQFGDVRNPYTNTWNIGARKAFQLEHGVVLQFRADAFNALNHPQFGNVNTSNTSAFFGYVNGSNTLSQVNDPRSIQFAGRITF